MANFAYEARDADGHLVAGLVAANSLEHAGQLLSTKNLFVVRMATESPSPLRSSVRRGASRAQVAWQMSQLSIMVQTGIPLSEALDCLARQAAQPRLRSLLDEISKNVREGRSLSDAMAMHPGSFPASLVALIRASEMSGTMSQVLQRSSIYLVNELQLLKRIRAAVMYPAFMLVLCLVITVFLLLVILPRFADIFASRGAILPLPTRVLMGLSGSLIAYWYAWVLCVVFSATAVFCWQRTAAGQRLQDYVLISAPILSGVFNSLYQSRMFRTLSVLIDSGVSLVDAVRIIQEVVPNSYYRELWKQVDHQIHHGERISGPLLASDLIPEPYAQMIDSGDRAGKLGFVCSRLADFVEQDYDQKTRTATQFIEPCMILVMGAIIGVVAASLMLPLFQASQVVGR